MEERDVALLAAIIMSSIMSNQSGKELDFPTHARRAVQAARILLQELRKVDS